MFVVFWLLVSLGVFIPLEAVWWKRVAMALTWPIGFGIVVAEAWKDLRKAGWV